MIKTSGFPVTKVAESKLNSLSLENIPFGKYFSDHMFMATYKNGAWQDPQILPYQPLHIEPSLAALHYGQAIFEGIKAYKHSSGEAFIFRPYDNFKRFNLSAERMCMPEVPEYIFMDGMHQLLAIDKDWIPAKAEHSLYIRPVMFATDVALGVRPSETYAFIIMLSPTGPYYAKPMKIYVEETYTRAVKGGVGFAKNAGNYGGSMMAAKKANELGYDQVLWTDAIEHKWLQEVGMMNVVFIIDNKAITPSLEEGTILNGVTRNSVLVLLQEMGIAVEERKINIDEVIAAYKNGTLQEVFGTGTAATIALIKELRYKDEQMLFDTEKWKVAPAVREKLNQIRYGLVPDVHEWLYKI
ncbi:branched-chain amino acid aminotransferase [Hydrotalea sandarakina]|jgi:branched-chain amino acid aminotransferase|uniref:branched-chain-amino-acid transaminase n=1 Tax=Hydrotalea sandarakina TaxID=1004304 RepID=A0A2W7RW99_9BACT|nr:branched-chain amino acid aminotransferase [Hydrotalea sandarakina]PZX64761.1 branched-chain amino acid aminotransferase [Hydrotalea sandarakina]